MSTDTRPTINAGTVPDAFDDVAETYDLMVGLSPGYHSQLRASARAVVEALPTTPGRRPRVLDLGCGSGASTRALVSALGEAGVDAEIVGVDGSAGMLRSASSKPALSGVTFAQADAEHLTSSDLGSFDGVLTAYLFRNVAARDRLIGEIREVLAPGGVLVVHDYSVGDSLTARWAWHATCWGVIVPLGMATAPQSPIYRYLWRSVLSFDGVRGFADRLWRGGLTEVETRTVSGWQAGQVHAWRARKASA
ncbi:class I SAM-dependent methyltransferase [Nocardioides bruguierae]|uniref:Class I SAM-dependent methyltransferase n=1 Tax=Nocardioides bruguierae TaxID=2945102 RepID=A0A9X2DC72_9ACTN|nr:class I SAM-dependent methyltransferase [Nocardioides bruguierae]MCM0621824.1 class I SAM-dependent methyltransferase [Nocardioides bruguierae]